MSKVRKWTVEDAHFQFDDNDFVVHAKDHDLITAKKDLEIKMLRAKLILAENAAYDDMGKVLQAVMPAHEFEIEKAILNLDKKGG